MLEYQKPQKPIILIERLQKLKQLYIRKGNSKENKNILIIGEEAKLGSRDSAYCTKGTVLNVWNKKDPYTGTESCSYIHACKNILLDSKQYPNDHAVHKYVKTYCKDLVTWDGESNTGLTNSREAFIVKGPRSVNETVRLLRKRIEAQVHPKGSLQRVLANWKLRRVNRKPKTPCFRISIPIVIAICAIVFPSVRSVLLQMLSISYEILKGLLNLILQRF